MNTILKQYAKPRPKKLAIQSSVSAAAPKGDGDNGIVGLHVFGNLYDIDPAIATDKEFLRKTVLKAIEIAKMHLVYERSDSFGGAKGGVSIVALVTESHCVVHTWNEYKYATVDIYTCGEHSDPHAAFNYIVQALKPKRHQMFFANRSSQ